MQRLSDFEMSRIETERRMVLRILHASSTVGANEELIFRALQRQRYPTLRHEVRSYTDYLEQKGLAKIEDRDADVWQVFITANGIDVIDGVIKTPPGIARG